MKLQQEAGDKERRGNNGGIDGFRKKGKYVG
jgi:hypothetical protein